MQTTPDDNIDKEKEGFKLYKRENTGPIFTNKIFLLFIFIIIGLLIYIYGRKEVKAKGTSNSAQKVSAPKVSAPKVDIVVSKRK